MITACMATFPPRAGVIEKTLDSLIGQVDRIRVYANQYESGTIPSWAFRDGIEVFLGDDLGDNGKVAYVPATGYVFLVDDDIIYPPNYVSRMVDALSRYGDKAIVGCHAAVMQPPIRNYFKDRTILHFNAAVFKDAPVNVLGTGCLAYHTDYVDFDLSDSPCPNMLDVHFAVWCQKNRKKMISVARPPGWLKGQKVPDSLWQSRGDGATQTHYINRIDKWMLY